MQESPHKTYAQNTRRGADLGADSNPDKEVREFVTKVRRWKSFQSARTVSNSVPIRKAQSFREGSSSRPSLLALEEVDSSVEEQPRAAKVKRVYSANKGPAPKPPQPPDNKFLGESETKATEEVTPISHDYSCTDDLTMKLRGSQKISRTKTMSFLIIAIFLLLLGISLLIEGLLMEYKWNYDVKIFYKPYWLAVPVILSAMLVFVFCFLRTPEAGVTVATFCLPTLALSIIMLIFCGLMADSLQPRDNVLLCSSYLSSSTTVQCTCKESIRMTVELRLAIVEENSDIICEDQIEFMYELMIAAAVIAAVIIFLLFYFIFFVYIAATRITYEERRHSAFHGSYPPTETFRRHNSGVIGSVHSFSPVVYQNRSPSHFGTLNRSKTLLDQASVTRPIVTVQRYPSNPGSRTGTWKSYKAPQPPYRQDSNNAFTLPPEVRQKIMSDSPRSSSPPPATPPQVESDEENTILHSVRDPPQPRRRNPNTDINRINNT